MIVGGLLGQPPPTTTNTTTFCNITGNGYINTNSVYNTTGVRLGFNLNPNTPVDRKGNNEERNGG